MNNAYTIQLNFVANTAQFNASAKEVKNELKSITDNSVNSFNSVGDGATKAADTGAKQSKVMSAAWTVATAAIAKVASSAFNKISENIGNAVSRVDTLNNFPKVMSNFGVSAQDANKMINQLDKGVQGLPTSLDSIVSLAQSFVPVTKNTDKAAKTALALNNALIAGGAGADVQSAALEQFRQALAKGKPELEDWRALEVAMPAQLQQVAKQLGLGTGAMAKYGTTGQGLYDAMKDGKITMDDFNNAMITLNEQGLGGFPSFADQAKNASGGLQTAMANSTTAITRGIADIIQAIGSDTIAQSITNTGKTIENVLKSVADFIRQNRDEIMKWVNVIQSNAMPALSVFATALAGVKIQQFTGSMGELKKSITKVYQAGIVKQFNKALYFDEKPVTKYSKSLLSSIPTTRKFSIGVQAITKSLTGIAFTPLQVGLMAVVGALVFLQTKFNIFGKLADALGPTFENISNTVGSVFQNISSTVGGVLSNIGPAIGNVIGKIATVLGNLASSAAPVIGKVFQTLGNVFSNIASSAGPAIAKIFQTIGNVLSKLAATAGPLVAKLFQTLGNTFQKLGPTISKFVSSFGQIVDQLFPALGPMIESIVTLFTTLGSSVADIAVSLVQAFVPLIPVFVQLATTIGQLVAQLVTSLVPVIGQIIKLVVQLIPIVLPIITSIIKGVAQIAAAVLPLVVVIVKAIGTIALAVAPLIVTIVNGIAQVIAAILPAVTQIITAVAPVITMIVQGIAGILAAILPIVTTVITIVAQIIAAIVPVITFIVDIAAQIIAAVAGIVVTIINIVMGIVTTIINIITGIIGVVTAIITAIIGVVGGIIGAISGIFSAVVSVVGGIISGIIGIVTGVINTVVGVFRGIVGTISGIFQSVANAIGSIFRGISDTIKNIINGLVNIIKTPINWIIDGINGFIDGINSLKIPDWVPGVGGKSLNLPKMKRLATGGIISQPTVALVGESGREAVMPLENNTGWLDEIAAKLEQRMSGSGVAATGQVAITNNYDVNTSTDVTLISRDQSRLLRRLA